MKMINPFLAFCLVVTCNAELRTWTAVNGKKVEAEFVSNEKGVIKLKLKSGKIFEVPANKLVKEDNEFISSLSKPKKTNLKLESTNYNNLEIREDIIYLKNSDTPYTGKYFILHNNGKKKAEGKRKDGKEVGLSVVWYKNGQKSLEITFKNGKMNGPSTRWHKNGNKSAESIFKDDEVIEGSQKYWKSEGELVESAKEAGLE